MKKLLVPLVILLVSVFLITGCGGASPTPTKPAVTTPPATIAPVATTPAATTPAATTPSATTPAATKPAPTTPATGTQTYGGTLRFISTAVPGTPIGWMSETAGASTNTMQLAMEFCFKELIDGTLIPHLGLSYDLDANPANPNLTIKLRQGVKFHDGSDFNAQALKWNLEAVKAGTVNAGTTRFWKSFEIVDDYTFKIYFTEWQNRLLRGFADASTYIASPTAFEKNGLEWIRWNMVGTAAFQQTGFQRDVSLTTKKFDNYWDKGKPYLDGIQLLYVVDELTRIALLKSGGAEIMDLAGNGRVATDLKADGYQIIQKTGGATALIPDSANPNSPWANQKVREAVEHAIDKEALARTFGYGYWKAAYQLNSPATASWVDNFAGERKYDVAKAKQLLAEAGYPNGFRTTIIASSAGNRDIPVAIQGYLLQIGIQANIDLMEGAKYQQALTAPWTNGVILNSMLEWPNYNNGLNFYFSPTTAFFKSMKRPDGWNDLFGATISSPLPDAELMRKAVRALYDEASVISLYYGAAMYAAQPNVRDTGLDTRSSIFWNQADTWLAK